MHHSDMTFPHHMSLDAALEHFGQNEWFMNHPVWDAETTPYPEEIHPISGEEPEKMNRSIRFPGHARAVKQATSSAGSSVEYLARAPPRLER
jgi:hypothetical protein